VTLKRSHVDDLATLGKILVNIGLVTSEFKREFAEFLPGLGCNLTIVLLASENGFRHWNSDFNVLIGRHICTLREILVS